jgi:spermidine synthase
VRPFETLAAAHTSEGRELTLHHRDGDYFIQLDGDELMSTRRSASERYLGEEACRALLGVHRPRVLIGGLGLGFTLRAVLEGRGDAEVVVAEVFPEVVEWGIEHLRPVHGATLEDPRVRVEVADVWELLVAEARWDAVLLDVDNGPEAWCLESNSRLYSGQGLERMERSLGPGGLLAVWAARPAPRFVRDLGARGWEVTSRTMPAHGQRGTRHVVVVAKPPVVGAAPPSSRRGRRRR